MRIEGYGNSTGGRIVAAVAPPVSAARRWRRFVFAWPLVLLFAATTISITLFPAAAHAWDHVYGYGGNGFSVSLWSQEDSNGNSQHAVVIQKGNLVYVSFDQEVIDAVFDKYLIGGSNPDPEGSIKGTEKPNVADLIKHFNGDLHLKAHVLPENSPLAEWIGTNGLGPRWNPSDQDGGKSPGTRPTRDNGIELSPKARAHLLELINADAKALRRIGSGMGTGEEGGSENAPGPGIGNHGTGRTSIIGDKKDFTAGQDKTVGKTEKLGPHPELINPDPKAKSATAVKSETSVVKCTTESCLAKKNSGALK